MTGGRPKSFELPDLSGLDNALTANHVLEMTFRGRAFPPGEASGLVTALARTTESALESYERSRQILLQSTNSNSFGMYLKGLSEMEICITALDRAMRVAGRLATSAETMVSDADLLPKKARTRLSRMRNAIDHVDKPLAAGRFGGGKYLFLYISESELVINDEGGELRVKQQELANWVVRLHALTTALSREPQNWAVGEVDF